MATFLGDVDLGVIGSGPGGIAAAAAASSCGMSVCVVDALATVGGNLPHSSGYIALAGTRSQSKWGVEDTPALFAEDLRREATRAATRFGGRLLEDVMAQYVSGGAETHDWLTEAGVSFRGLISRPARHSRDRLHALSSPVEATQRLRELLESSGVLLVPSLRVIELELAGERVDIEAVRQPSGERLAFTAHRGVVIATGGFQANFDWRAEHQPAWLSETPYLGVPTALGDGHGMIASAGGELINMGFLPPFGHIATSFTEEAIAVNTNGMRFHDETDPHELPDHLARQPNTKAYYLFDDRTMQAKKSYLSELGRRVVRAATLEELTSELSLPHGNVQSTIDSMNSAVARGTADSLDVPRANLPSRAISVPPFYALEVVVGVSVTYGGAATTPTARVIDRDGVPIPGLFAVGNANGSLAPVVEVGGVNLGAAFVLGRAAGFEAAHASNGVSAP